MWISMQTLLVESMSNFTVKQLMQSDNLLTVLVEAPSSKAFIGHDITS